jgi:hypothetical protein
VKAFSLLPPINDEEWTLAVACLEYNLGADDDLYFIKILQILKSNFQLSARKPIENHEIILTGTQEMVLDHGIKDKCFHITWIAWLRPGVFTIIYYDSESKKYLTISDLANSKSLYFDN